MNEKAYCRKNLRIINLAIFVVIIVKCKKTKLDLKSDIGSFDVSEDIFRINPAFRCVFAEKAA